MLLGFAALAAGCAEPPTARVDAAKQELAALANEAATYASGAYATAEDAVEQLDAELVVQEASFALMRDYERAIGLVGAVESATGQVRQAIAAERQRLSMEANGFAAELQAERDAAAERAARGEITIPRTVMVDGQSLAAGMYLLQLAEDAPDSAGRWIEFVSDGDVAGRGLAVVIQDTDVGEVAKSPPPRNEAQVMELREGEYVRVWLNRDGTNYLLHLPTS
jgi:hypothetical protein